MSTTQPVRFGISSPIVTLAGRAADSWEVSAGPEELREVALAAERLGYEYVTCSEHVGIPSHIAPVRGGRYYDPLSTFGFLAALTQRLRFLTNVLVLGYHHPLEIAKRYGTLDRICGGRLILGVGVGSLREEFELLDAPFDDRGDRYTEALQALRAAWAKRQPEFSGKYYRFSDFIIDPCAVNARLPIWLGGRTLRSLRRAVDAAEGWNPFSLSAQDVSGMLERVRGTEAWERRERPLDIALAPDGPADASRPGGADAYAAAVERSLEAGATVINVSPRADSLQHYVEQLEAVAADVIPRFAGAGSGA